MPGSRGSRCNVAKYALPHGYRRVVILEDEGAYAAIAAASAALKVLQSQAA